MTDKIKIGSKWREKTDQSEVEVIDLDIGLVRFKGFDEEVHWMSLRYFLDDFEEVKPESPWKPIKSAPYGDEIIVLTQANQVMTALRFAKQKTICGTGIPEYWTIQIFAKNNELIDSVSIETPKRWMPKFPEPSKDKEKT